MKIHRWSYIGCMFFMLCCAAMASTAASSPTASIKGPIDEIIGVLNDPQFGPQDKKSAQRDKIWQIARPMFDAETLSRRVIGKPWKSFSDNEKSRFTDIFARFLGATYIGKMQGENDNVKIDYNKELIKGDRALVRTRVMRESLAIAIDYRMKKTNGQWKIYDVLVENGVSLVRNYRVQFSSILQKETPAQLIKRLEQKLGAESSAPSSENAPSSSADTGK